LRPDTRQHIPHEPAQRVQVGPVIQRADEGQRGGAEVAHHRAAAQVRRIHAIGHHPQPVGVPRVEPGQRGAVLLRDHQQAIEGPQGAPLVARQFAPLNQ